MPGLSTGPTTRGRRSPPCALARTVDRPVSLRVVAAGYPARSDSSACSSQARARAGAAISARADSGLAGCLYQIAPKVKKLICRT